MLSAFISSLRTVDLRRKILFTLGVVILYRVGATIPSPGVNYKNVSVLSRTDGVVIQAVEGGDMKGYNDDREVVDRAESERAVGLIAELFGERFRT